MRLNSIQLDNIDAVPDGFARMQIAIIEAPGAREDFEDFGQVA